MRGARGDREAGPGGRRCGKRARPADLRKIIRATALRHALPSYLFGAVIVATTINRVAGLAKWPMGPGAAAPAVRSGPTACDVT